MAYHDITAAELEPGQHITAWWKPDGNSGSGGDIVAVRADAVDVLSGTAQIPNTFEFAEVHHFTVERPLPAEDCLEFHTGDCAGPVKYCPTPPQGMRSLPRCEHHNTLRWDRFSDPNSSERYAHSDAAPSGFNRSWGGANEYGEHWDESDY